MDPDSSTGLNTSSDSASANYDYHVNDFDSGSKQSAASETERTNIDALDDTARDTLIALLEDSHSSHSVKSVKRLMTMIPDGALHDELDFEGGDEDEGQQQVQNQSRDADDDDDGEIEDDDEEEAEETPTASAGTPTTSKPPRQREDEEEGELEESEESNDEDRNSGLEDGEVDDEPKKKTMIKTGRANIPREELEEGEVTDDEDRNKDPKPVCRFFGKGQCTWGSNCRFLHPGVTDKGLYTMFDPMRPLPTPPTHFPIKTGLLGHAPPNFAPIIKLEEPVIESAWERGLRHAKEIIKKSVIRKETDVDFEEKKMNLSLAQEEIDKENDYYSRKSPKERVEADEDQFDDYNSGGGPSPPIPSGPRDWPPPPVVHPPAIDAEFVRERVHHLKPSRGIREAPPRDAPIREAPPLHESEVRMVRESALRRSRFQEEFRGGGRGGRGFEDPRKAEEWHDPWMRSPGHRKTRKDSSLSKRSSYSSGSSKSSSKSSISSKSSRSSRSSSSNTKSSKGSRRTSIKPEVVRKVAPPRRVLSPKPVRIAPPPPPSEEFGRRTGFGGGGGGGGGPRPHYERDRITRYAPPPPHPPHKSGVKDRQDKTADKLAELNRNNPIGGDRDRGGPRQPINKRNAKWSGSSRSRSRSRSRSPWSKSPWSKSSKSRSRSRSVKRRSKFVRNRSNSTNLSRSPIPPRKASWSRSRSRSLSSSSSRSSSLEMKSLKRKRSAPPKDVKPSVDLLGQPIEKMSKLDEPRHSRAVKSDSKTQAPSKSSIKLTLKTQTPYKANKTVLDKLADDIDAESDSNSFKDGSSPQRLEGLDDNSNSSGKNTGSPRESRQSKLRRDELLKQLKAVEDAIAKKRSKLV